MRHFSPRCRDGLFCSFFFWTEKKTKKEKLIERFSLLYPSLNQDEIDILLSDKKAVQNMIDQIDGKI